MTDVATNPESGVDGDQNEDQVTDQASTDIDHSDDDAGDEQEEGSQDEDDEYEEVERGDKKYRVPKALKPELMMEADYRRKTQELAEKRKAYESEVTAFKGATKEIDDVSFELKAVSSRISDLSALTEADWHQVRLLDQQNGTNNYDRFQRELMTLPRKADELKTKLDSKEREAVSKQQEILAKRIDEGQAILARDIPGWGPELGAKLVNFVKTEFGVDESRHSEAFLDPALVKMAHAAFRAKEAERKSAAIKRVESVPTPVPQSRGGAVAAKDPNKMSAKEYADYRDKQVGPGR